MLLFAYESAAENAPRWPEGEGLEFNDPVALLEGTAAQAIQALREAAGGDWSALALGTLAAYQSVPPCTSPPPAHLDPGGQRGRRCSAGRSASTCAGPGT